MSTFVPNGPFLTRKKSQLALICKDFPGAFQAEGRQFEFADRRQKNNLGQDTCGIRPRPKGSHKFFRGSEYETPPPKWLAPLAFLSLPAGNILLKSMAYRIAELGTVPQSAASFAKLKHN